MPTKLTLLPAILLILTSLDGCFSTYLEPYIPPTDLSSLVDSSRVKLPICIRSSLDNTSRGYQYLFFALPLARIYTDDLKKMVLDKITTNAGLAGMGLIANSTCAERTPHLQIQIKHVRVNGYDFVAIRKPSASITIDGVAHLSLGTVRECKASGSFSEYKRFAFAPDLSRALENATQEATTKLLKCFELGNGT